MAELPWYYFDNSWRSEPIPGAPEGKCWRLCDKPGHTDFYLVKAFHGVNVYQCLTCRKIAKAETRTGKTCLSCGKALTGRQQNWCGSETCGPDVAACHDRAAWREAILRRDGRTCQRCGWHPTPEQKRACEEAYEAICQEMYKLPRDQWMSSRRRDIEAMRRSGWRELEAHHVHPLERGGAEFDIENGLTLCHLCHDQEHRELNATRARRLAESGGKDGCAR